MSRKGKRYHYKGEELTLDQLCERFKVKKYKVYRKIRFDKMYILDALKDETPFKYDSSIYDRKLEEFKINTETNEQTLIIHKIICSVFGCNKELSMQEKLFGTKCINCQYELSKKNKNPF